MSSKHPLGSVPDKNNRQPSHVPRNRNYGAPQKKRNLTGIIFFFVVVIAGTFILFQVFNEEVGRVVRTIAPMKVTGVIEAQAFGQQASSESGIFLVQSPSPEISTTLKKGVTLFNILSTGTAREDKAPLNYNESMVWNDLIAAFPPKVTTEIVKSQKGKSIETKFEFHKGEFRSDVASHTFIEMSQTLWRRFRDELDDADPRNLAPVLSEFQEWISRESRSLGTYYSRDQAVDDRNIARKAADQEFIKDIRRFLPRIQNTASRIKQSANMGMSRAEALTQWRAFCRNDVPRIQSWIERNQTASTSPESDGYFEIEGKGLLIVAVPIRDNLVYFSETNVPAKIGLAELKNSF